jgi:plastocyanin
MRLCHFLAPALGTVVLIAFAPQPASACHWWHHHHGPMYGPAYYAPAPVAYAPPVSYGAPMYYAPAPGAYAMPGPMSAMRMAPATTAATVSAADNRFEPPTLTVQPGTTVRWTNTGAHPHTVTDRGGKFDSGDIAPGATYSMTFQTPGTYRYYCKHHKGMEGTIVVGSTGPAPAGGSGGGSNY